MTHQELQTIIDTQRADIDELNRKLKEAEERIKTWISISDEKDSKIEELKFRIASIKAVTAAI
jgi:uncharacterized coiled-coil DUF342 family protein